MKNKKSEEHFVAAIDNASSAFKETAGGLVSMLMEGLYKEIDDKTNEIKQKIKEDDDDE